MGEKNRQWSKPDYDAWKHGVREVANLPSLRFYFVVPVAAMVAISCGMIHFGHWAAGFAIAVLILVFGAAAFLMQWRREGYSIEESKAEPSHQPIGADSPSESGQDDGRSKCD